MAAASVERERAHVVRPQWPRELSSNEIC